MESGRSMVWRLALVAIEVLFITILDYKMSGGYYSLDVLYSLPIIQAAHISSIRAARHSDTQMSALVGVITAVAWSIAEAAVIWPNYPLGAFTMNIFTRSVTFTVLGRVVTKLWKERNYYRKDALTGLVNRFQFNERFTAEQLRSVRSNKPFSLLYLSIDQLKTLNDLHGRRVGDSSLKAFSGIMKGNCRVVDTVARIGEDKFAILFPETDEYVCGVLLLRIKVASEKLFQEQGWPISLSIGRTTLTSSEKSLDEVLQEIIEKMASNPDQVLAP